MPTDELVFRDWNKAAIWLLKGVVDTSDERTWGLVLSNVSQLETFFHQLGLVLVVDEPEGLAYVRQFTSEEAPEGYDTMPKLFRSTRLSYAQTMLCVLLREEYRRFEDEDTVNQKCVVPASTLLAQWKAMMPPGGDDVKLGRQMTATLRRLEELGFVREFGKKPRKWEIRRALKARLPAADLEHLKNQLLTVLKHRTKSVESP